MKNKHYVVGQKVRFKNSLSGYVWEGVINGIFNNDELNRKTYIIKVKKSSLSEEFNTYYCLKEDILTEPLSDKQAQEFYKSQENKKDSKLEIGYIYDLETTFIKASSTIKTLTLKCKVPKDLQSAFEGYATMRTAFIKSEKYDYSITFTNVAFSVVSELMLEIDNLLTYKKTWREILIDDFNPKKEEVGFNNIYKKSNDDRDLEETNLEKFINTDRETTFLNIKIKDKYRDVIVYKDNHEPMPFERQYDLSKLEYLKYKRDWRKSGKK